jgi:membrane protease YdiL (CAAX protease family)
MKPMFSFRRMLALTASIVFALLVSTLLANRIVALLGLGLAWKVLLGGILPALASIAITVAIEVQISGEPLAQCLKLLGLGWPNREQMLTSVLGSTPILASYLILFFGLDKSSELHPLWPLLIVKFIIAQGVAEEIVFRGLAFRHLRAGRSFWRAATLSAVLFSAVHFANLIHGISAEVLTGIAVSLVFSFMLAYPLAYLFERGGNVLWGCAFFHVAVDSINWFTKATDEGVGPDMLIYLTGIAIACLMVFFVAHALRRADALPATTSQA